MSEWVEAEINDNSSSSVQEWRISINYCSYFSPEPSLFMVILLQFLVFFWNTKVHDLLSLCKHPVLFFSELWQWVGAIKSFSGGWRRGKYEESYRRQADEEVEQLLRFLSSHFPSELSLKSHRSFLQSTAWQPQKLCRQTDNCSACISAVTQLFCWVVIGKRKWFVRQAADTDFVSHFVSSQHN